MNANNVNLTTLSAELSRITTDVCSGDRAIRNKWQFLGEAYHSEGITSTMLAKVGRGEFNPNEKLHLQIDTAITVSFDKEVQKILKAEPKTLDQVQKGVRHYWIQQRSSLFNKIRGHVVEAEKSGKDKDTRTTRPKTERALEHLGNARKLVKSMESATFDIKAFDLAVQQAEKILKGK